MERWRRYRLLRKVRKNFLKRDHRADHKMIMNKVCHKYFIQGFLFGAEDIVIVFKGTYIRDFKTRCVDWIEYIGDCIDYFLMYINVKERNRDKRSHKPYKPMHIKLSDGTDEIFLEHYLLCSGFEIEDEILQSLRSIYIIKPDY